MKNIFKLLFTIWFALAPNTVHAQLAPAAIKPLPTFNAIANGGFENGKTGWLTYKDAAGALPVDGVSGTATTVSFTAPTTTPLFEKASGLITHAASNGQGEGIAYDFVVNSGDKGKVLAISGTYQIASGTYSGGTSTTDSDIEVYIYNKDTATLVQPSGYKLDGGVIGVNYPIGATFQTDITSTNYRLIFHNATTTATAFTIKLDSLYVGTQTKAQGPPVTDWVSYTPTGTWVANSTYTGRWRRVGDSMEGMISISTSGAPTAAGLIVDIPAGYTIDTAKHALTGSAATGFGQAIDSGTVGYNLQNTYSDSNSVIVLYQNDGTQGSQAQVTNTAPFTFGSGDIVNITYKVPITGWSSSVTMSQDSSNGRDVALIVTRNGGSFSADTTIPSWSTPVKDTLSAFNATTGVFTVPVPGLYFVNFTFRATATVAGSAAVMKNGVEVYAGQTNDILTTKSVSALVDCKAGDTLSVTSTVGATFVSSDLLNFLNIFKLSSNQSIAASESINARYTNTAGTTINTGVTTIPFATKVYDSHGAYASPTYTCPAPGKYQVSVSITTNSMTLSTTQAIESYVYKNGALNQVFPRINGTGGAGNNYGVGGTVTVDCLAGETLDVRALSNVSVNMITSAGYNTLSIQRVGN